MKEKTNNKLKVLFINISDIQGGSAKAAFRLGTALEAEHDTENLYLVRTKRSNAKNVLQTRKGKLQENAERGFNILFNLLGLQYQYLPFSPGFILKKAREFQPDIISLHNTIGGYFKTKDLIKLSEISPVYWTLHDMWAFTRNASYTFGNDAWKKGNTYPGEKKIFPWIGLDTGKMLLNQKRRIYTEAKFRVITPSKWLGDLAKESPLLENKEIHNVFNGIDLNTFKIYNNDNLKKKYNINPQNKVIMFIAETIKKNNWKLGNELQQILETVHESTNEQITLLILGKGEMPYLSSLNKYDVISPGYVFDDKTIAEMLSMSDVFIYPSKQDNLPTVLIESIACGTPCVTFDVGGCGEIIKNDYNGKLIKPFDTEQFSKETIELLKDNNTLKLFSSNSRKFAEENFDVKLMAKNYYNLFLAAR